MSQTTFDRLKEQFKFTLMLIFDERSMLSAPVLGAVERNCRQLMHNGMNHNHMFGLVPIILLFGDDHQLPSINVFGNGRGATWIFDENLNRNNDQLKSKRNCKPRQMERQGFDHFISLAENVIEFRKTHRIEAGQTELCAILKNMTNNGGVTETQAQILMDRHLGSSGKIDQVRKLWLEKNAIWIMPTNEQVMEKNFSKMQQLVTKDNPICNILAKTLQTETNTLGTTRRSHFLPEDQQQKHSSLCRNSINALDRNIFAEHGLYNGAPVIPLEPRFKHGENPNLGHVPAYILSYCPTYTGPPWLQDHPKWVPIPMVRKLCRYRCCQIRQAPLQLAFARTGHKFQGQQVGPNHSIQAMIADPGTHKYESMSPGYTYMLCSRVSTLGEDANNSALYFYGNNVNENRFTNLISTKTGEKFVTVQRRDNWIKFINQQKQTTDLDLHANTKRNLKIWATTTKIGREELSNIIHYHAHSNTVNAET